MHTSAPFFLKLIPFGCLLFSIALNEAKADPEPVAFWRMGEVHQGIVPDLTGNDLDLILGGGDPEVVEGPHGPVLKFPGDPFGGHVVDNPRLVMTDAVTVDAWIKPARPESDHFQVILDKNTDRYRLMLSPAGSPHFGVKDADHRGDVRPDLTLIPEEWVRLTGVFKRPILQLYVDGVLVEEVVWDHQITAGGNLTIGRKGRGHYFEGAIDMIAVYDHARPPQEDDYTMLRERFELPIRTLSGLKDSEDLVLEEEEGGVSVVGDGWSAHFENTGAVQARIGERTLIDTQASALIQGVLLDSENRSIPVKSELSLAETSGDGGAVVVRYEGRVADDEEVFTAGLTVDWRFEPGQPGAKLQVSLEEPSENEWKVERLGVHFPLAMQQRKRIAQGGENGIHWDTRYYYQFTVAMGRELMMPPMRTTDPDTNIWRHFWVEQTRPGDFRIWRSESDSTSALLMQRGREVPGWTAVYDQEGGVILGTRQMSDRAPKSWYVAASGQGEAVYYLFPPTAAPQPVGALADSVFGPPHDIEMLFAGKELHTRDVAEHLSEHGYPGADDAATPKRVESQERWELPEGRSASAPMVAGGIPIPRGSLSTDAPVRLLYQGRKLPLQADPIGFWPDGSVKWVLLTFPLPEHAETTEAEGEFAESTRFEVTFRNDEPAEFLFEWETGEGDNETEIGSGMAGAHEEEGSIHVDAGRLQATFQKGADWLADLSLDGESVLKEGEAVEAVLDFFRPDEVYATETRVVEGEAFPGRLKVDELFIEEEGPLRTVICLKGRVDGEVEAKIDLRWEFHKDRPTVRLYHSVEFFNHDQRALFVREISLRLPLVLGTTEKVMVGGEQALEFTDGPVVELKQYSPHSYQIVDGENAILREGWRSRGWLAVEGENRSVLAGVRDLWQEFPKALSWDSAESTLTVALWPKDHALMDVRRYSNFPHRSQGETVSGGNDWVVDDYYERRESFAGTTKTHELLLSFAEGNPSAEEWDRLTADFQSRPLLFAGAETYRDTGVVLRLADMEQFPDSRRNLDNLIDFFLFHQDWWNWYGFWDYGDVQHHFRRGYGWILTPERLLSYWEMSEEERREVGRLGNIIVDYVPQHDWAHDNGRWGWTNTEGLPNLFFQNEYLRTGRRDLFFAVEALARHTRDVVMRHNGQYFGSGTRHGVQHWSDGHHSPRQTIQTETRHHYFLTGEPRTREFAMRLVQDSYTQGSTNNPNIHAANMYGLLFAWEMTGEEKWGTMLEKYAQALSAPDGISIGREIRFPGPEGVGPYERLNETTMMWHNFGSVDALLEYLQLTEDPKVTASMVAMGEAIAGGDSRQFTNTAKTIGFALRNGGDREVLMNFFQEWYESSRGAQNVLASVATEPEHWTGTSSFLSPNIPGLFFLSNGWPYFLTALDEKPELTESQRQTIANRLEQGNPRHKPRLSWQSQFDEPASQEYLGVWWPWTAESELENIEQRARP